MTVHGVSHANPSVVPSTKVEGKSAEANHITILQQITQFVQKSDPSSSSNERNLSLPLEASPKLPRPKYMAAHAVEGSLNLNERVSDGELLKRCLLALAEQEKLREEDVFVSKELLEQRGKRMHSLKERFNEISEHIEKQVSASQSLSWVSGAAAVLSGVLALGAAATVMISGGTTLSAVLGTASTLSGMASGGTEMYDALFLKKNMFKHQAESLKLKELRNLSVEELQLMLSNIQEDDQSISQLWSQMAELVRDRPKVFNS
jgi:hypothetical protein